MNFRIKREEDSVSEIGYEEDIKRVVYTRFNSAIVDFPGYEDRNNVGMHADGGRKRGWSKIIKKLARRWGLFVFPQTMADS